MTAAALTSPAAAARTVTTVRTEAAGALLGLLPAEGALSWVRRGEGLVGWGEAARLEVTGPRRAGRGRRVVGRRTPPGSTSTTTSASPAPGPVVFASIAFDPVAGTSVFVVPEVAVGRRDGVGWVTTVGDVDPRDADRRGPLPRRRRPAPRLRYADGALDPATWCAAVATAVQRIAAGELAKVVLARDLLVSADVPLDPRRLLRRLAARFPDCWTFAVDGLLGATPELLLRRRPGGELSARVLAGTAPRGAGAEDERLAAALIGSAKDRAEHALAVDSLVRALEPYCTRADRPGRARRCSRWPTCGTWPATSPAPSGSRGARGRAGLLELVGAVHPTAAVCGTPTADAAAVIAELEGMDRGRYAGPVGWLDARGDGEFGLALRCAELTGDDGARLFAGCGIVAGSDPAAELAETQSKFAAFQAALEG